MVGDKKNFGFSKTAFKVWKKHFSAWFWINKEKIINVKQLGEGVMAPLPLLGVSNESNSTRGLFAVTNGISKTGQLQKTHEACRRTLRGQLDLFTNI